ncbi:ATP-binding cassette domain-containing protein [Escherichia coli]|nr:ATP-binding cassette domain-containing protein [Escherichia coli]MCS1940000.1 ATP-binding cassette domain-containing protein [Escherichia coli]MCS1950264.1 ATP-binding cassette domain-containing protein [Escherichia coli]
MAAVILRKVEKIYDNGFKAVHGIDLDINDGEFMVFVGPSGCAKSTTLRMIAGLEDVSGGEIYISDRLSNLDAKLRVSMRVKIAQLHQSLKDEGHPATMIYVTHDQIEALTLGDRICVLNQGRIMQVDTPVNLYNHPANRFVAGFIGSPSMNLIDAVVREEDGKLYIDIAKNIRLYIPENKQSVLKAYIDKPVCFGIRPEHISLSVNCKEMNTVTGALSIIENMGSEKYLYFTVNNKEFIAKVNDQSITTADIGKNLYFNLDTSFCHIFDFYTEENLTNYL